MSARKNCAKCLRWRHVLDFSARAWTDKTKTQVQRVQSYCRYCQNQDLKARRAKPETIRERKSRQASARAIQRKIRRQQGAKERGPYVVGPKKPGSVRREPFARWLVQTMESEGLSYGELSVRIGVAERLIRSYVMGYDYAGHYKGSQRKNGNVRARKLRAVDWVSLNTVDRAFTAMGQPWLLEELYPVDDVIGDDF